MVKYKYNPYCSCSRCRIHGYMGPAVLITLGVLFLLSQATRAYWLEFNHTWPALLIVIGLVMFLEHSAPANGHVPRTYAASPAAPAYPPGTVQPAGAAQPGAPVVTPPPVPLSGNLPAAAGQAGERPDDREVHNG